MNYISTALGLIFLVTNFYGVYLFFVALSKKWPTSTAARKAIINLLIVGSVVSLAMSLGAELAPSLELDQELKTLTIFILSWGFSQTIYSFALNKTSSWATLLSGFMVFYFLINMQKNQKIINTSE